MKTSRPDFSRLASVSQVMTVTPADLASASLEEMDSGSLGATAITSNPCAAHVFTSVACSSALSDVGPS